MSIMIVLVETRTMALQVSVILILGSTPKAIGIFFTEICENQRQPISRLCEQTVNGRTGKYVPGRTYPETKEIRSLFDRFWRVTFWLCLVRPVDVRWRLVVIFVAGDGMQCICSHLFTQANRLITSPGGYRRILLRILHERIHQALRDRINLARVDPQNVELQCVRA